MTDSNSSALWLGSLKEGKGSISTGSGALTDEPYSFGTRFGDDLGTNPEELIAAAHAGCFSMALAAELGKSGIEPDSISTKCTVSLDAIDGKPTVKKSHLEVKAKLNEGDEAAFKQAAEAAKAGCPISRLLNAEITMEASLER